MAQAYTTGAELVALFTELAGVADDLRDFYVDMTREMVALELWGDRASFAHSLLAAHMIASHPGVSIPGVSAPVTSRRMGEIATTYANTGAVPSDADLARTQYGQNYLAIRRGVFVGPIAKAVC